MGRCVAGRSSYSVSIGSHASMDRTRRMRSQSFMKLQTGFLILLLGCLAWGCSRTAPDVPDAPRPAGLPEMSFSQSSESVECYDFVDVTIRVDKAYARSPFTEVFVSGTFGRRKNQESFRVEGFCDSSDGSIFRIRFMPLSSPGDKLSGGQTYIRIGLRPGSG